MGSENLQRIVAQIEYDGTQTSGWACQPGMTTVEGFLQQAVERFTGHPCGTIGCAGRTDKGVHATAQVISFDTPVQRLDDRWITGLNHYLPDHIRILRLRSDLGPDFHARYKAQSRCYRYYIHLGRPSPLLQTLITPYRHKPPCVTLLNELCQEILGTHDFQAFQGGSCHAKTSVRHVYEAFWQQHGDMLIFQIRAQSFLHHMVRFLVGCLLETASGRQSRQWWSDLIATTADQHCCMPAQGLYLCHAQYQGLEDVFPMRYPWFDSIAKTRA